MTRPCVDAPVPRLLCVCADDFGMTGGINAAIISLAHAGRISATGCMVKRDAWSIGAKALRHVDASKVDTGLHLDFTHPLPGRATERRLPGLIARSYLGLLDRADVLREIRDQLARFEDELGRPPAFVDGHQHVHQLPTVRETLTEEISRRYGGALPWMRSTAPPPAHRFENLKARLIFALGGVRLLDRAARHGIPASRGLLGVYDFSGTAQDYRHRLERWLDQCRTGDVLMCHPSRGDAVSPDRIDAARRNEYAVLQDFEFPHRSPRGLVELVPFSQQATAVSAGNSAGDSADSLLSRRSFRSRADGRSRPPES